MSNENLPRRRFLQLAVAGAAAAPIALSLASRAQAADAAAPAALPHLAESDPTASALGYREDGSKVDAAKFAQHKPEQMCSNCNLAQGKAGDAWLPCSIFAGKAVNAKGWCAAYVKKA